MHTLQTDRLKSSWKDTVAENGNYHSRKPRVSQTSDGVALSAAPTYERAYDHLLSLEEAVDR